jgi:hypothetical protein
VLLYYSSTVHQYITVWKSVRRPSTLIATDQLLSGRVVSFDVQSISPIPIIVTTNIIIEQMKKVFPEDSSNHPLVKKKKIEIGDLNPSVLQLKAAPFIFCINST